MEMGGFTTTKSISLKGFDYVFLNMSCDTNGTDSNTSGYSIYLGDTRIQHLLFNVNNSLSILIPISSLGNDVFKIQAGSSYQYTKCTATVYEIALLKLGI